MYVYFLFLYLCRKFCYVENIKVESDDEISVVSSRIEKMGKNFCIFVKINNNTKEVMENSKVELSILDIDNQELLKQM